MDKWVVVQDATDVIVNICIWDGGPKWSPPQNHTTYPWVEGADIGMLWNNGQPIPQE